MSQILRWYIHSLTLANACDRMFFSLYPVLVSIHLLYVIMRLTLGIGVQYAHLYLCANACISITFVSPSTQLCLCVSLHACDCVLMYQTGPICIRVSLPFKSFLHLPAYSMASGLQLCTSSCIAQPSPGFPHNLLLFVMHCTPLDYCRRRALHHHILQREAEADWKVGSGFKKTPIRIRYPTSPQAAEKSSDTLERGLRV